MIVLRLLFLCMLIACSGIKNNEEHSGGNENEVVHFDVKKKVLSNGLTVLVVKNEKLPIFSFYTFYKVGGKFEKHGTTGASHLLEHMMFKGAKKYGKGEYDKYVEGNGGQNNAYTTNDLTVYYETLPSAHFEIIADIEADRMQNLLLEKDSFEKERLVVLEERRMRYENSDRGKLYIAMMKNMFKGTPYGRSVIGEVSDLNSITRDDVQKYFKQFYTPNNAVIVIVGSLDPDKVFSVIEEKYGKIEPNKNLHELKHELLSKEGYEFQKNLGEDIQLKGSSPTPMFMLGFKGMKVGEKDAFVLDVLSAVLGEGESSYLNQKLVLGKKPVLQNVYAANYTLQDSGIFFVGGQLAEKVKINSFKASLKKELSDVCDKVVTPRAVNKVLNNYFASILKGLDTNAGVAQFLGDREVNLGSYNFYKKEFEIYQSITVDDLVKTCHKYINVNDSLFISIGK